METFNLTTLNGLRILRIQLYRDNNEDKTQDLGWIDTILAGFLSLTLMT